MRRFASLGLALLLGVAAPAGASATRTPAPRPAAVSQDAPGPLETPGKTTRVSLGTKNQQLAATSGSAGISTNGRYVVFRTSVFDSQGIDLGAIYLRDRSAGTTVLVAQGHETSGLAFFVQAVSQPAISGDGRWVVFVVGAPGAPAGGTLELWDRTTHAVAPALPAGTAIAATQPKLSFDGRDIAFTTSASLLPGDDNQEADVYLFDRTSGTFDEISISSSGAPGFRGESNAPSISSDGRIVAFASSMVGLVPRDLPPQVPQVFVRDRGAGTTKLISTAADGTPGSGPSGAPSSDGNGDAVAFASSAPNLVAGDGNGTSDIFVWAATTGTVERLSVAATGGDSNGPSGAPGISADGETVAFASGATNLVPGDSNDVDDIFVRDLVTGAETRVSVGPGPNQANGPSEAPAVSGSGRYVAFESDANDLVTGDTNKRRDVFVRDRTPRLTVNPSPLPFGSVPVGASVPPRVVTITSTGAGPATITATAITAGSTSGFAEAVDGCTDLVLHPGASCQVVISFAPAAAGPATGSLAITDDVAGSPQLVPLTATVVPSGPAITLDPTVGPPGIVVVVSGTGFVPGQPVALTWDAGLTATPLTPLVAAADGTFQAQVLLLPGDLLGPRNLVGDSVVSGVPGPTAQAPFLVVAHTYEPPVSPVIRPILPGLYPPLVQH